MINYSKTDFFHQFCPKFDKRVRIIFIYFKPWEEILEGYFKFGQIVYPRSRHQVVIRLLYYGNVIYVTNR